MKEYYWVPEDCIFDSPEECMLEHPRPAAALVANHVAYDILRLKLKTFIEAAKKATSDWDLQCEDAKNHLDNLAKVISEIEKEGL